ncbi:MAG: Hypothetical, related to broad specificity phosphatases COG0406, partial [uncultured Nocardioidaceae bacterium]
DPARDDHRAPAPPRRGPQPDRHPLRPQPRVQPLRPRPADGPAGRRHDRRPRHHPGVRLPARAGAADRAAAGDCARAAHRDRRAGHRVREQVPGQEVRRRQRGAQAALVVAAPLEPLAPLLGRALQAGRRPDGRGRERRPTRGGGPRDRRRLPPAPDLDDPALRREPCVRARPAQAAVHPVLAHLADLRGRAAAHDHLLRAGRRPHPGQGPRRGLLRRRVRRDRSGRHAPV